MLPLGMSKFRLGRITATELVKAAAKEYPITRRAGYGQAEVTSKFWWQSRMKLNQGDTGICVACTFVHRRADGPIPTSGLDLAYAKDLYVAATGDASLQQGTNAWYVCEELRARRAISHYYWVTNATQMVNTVLTVGTVCVGTDWHTSMFVPKRKHGKLFVEVDFTSNVEGGHEYLISGLELKPKSGPPFYRLKNSWGKDWGDQGNACIAVKDLHELLFRRGGDAVVITEL